MDDCAIDVNIEMDKLPSVEESKESDRLKAEETDGFQLSRNVGIIPENEDEKELLPVSPDVEKHGVDCKDKSKRISESKKSKRWWRKNKFKIFVIIGIVIVVCLVGAILALVLKKNTSDSISQKTDTQSSADSYTSGQLITDQPLALGAEESQSITAVLNTSHLNGESFLLRWRIYNETFIPNNRGVQYSESDGHFIVEETGTYVVYTKLALSPAHTDPKKLVHYQHCVEAKRNNGSTSLSKAVDCNNHSMNTGEKGQSVIFQIVYLRKGDRVFSTMKKQSIIQTYFPKSFFQMFRIC